jgi:hypothetical protein
MSEDCSGYYQLSQPGAGSCFYGGAQNGNEDCSSRFTNKACNTTDIDTISEIIKDAINLTGVPVLYYVNTTSLSSIIEVYGEQPTAVYHTPVEIMMYIELDEDAIQFSRFGIRADDNVTGFVHISSFTAAFSGDNIHATNGQYIEPKSDDVFELAEYGSTRPNGRTGKKFIITERMDSDINAMNPLGGHYTWRVRARRFEWSFEPGLSAEGGANQIYDNSFQGRLSGGDNPKTEDKTYPGDIDAYSRNNIFNMGNNDTSPYGSYD